MLLHPVNYRPTTGRTRPLGKTKSENLSYKSFSAGRDRQVIEKPISSERSPACSDMKKVDTDRCDLISRESSADIPPFIDQSKRLRSLSTMPFSTLAETPMPQNKSAPVFWQWSIRPVSYRLLSQEIDINTKIRQLLSIGAEDVSAIKSLPLTNRSHNTISESVNENVILEGNEHFSVKVKFGDVAGIDDDSANVSKKERSDKAQEEESTSLAASKKETSDIPLASNSTALDFKDGSNEDRKIIDEEVRTESPQSSPKGLINLSIQSKCHNKRMPQKTNGRVVTGRPSIANLLDSTNDGSNDTGRELLSFWNKMKTKAAVTPEDARRRHHHNRHRHHRRHGRDNDNTRHHRLLQKSFLDMPGASSKFVTQPYNHSIFLPNCPSHIRRPLKLSEKDEILQRVLINEDFETEMQLRKMQAIHVNTPASMSIISDAPSPSRQLTMTEEASQANKPNLLLESYFESFVDESSTSLLPVIKKAQFEESLRAKRQEIKLQERRSLPSRKSVQFVNAREMGMRKSDSTSSLSSQQSILKKKSHLAKPIESEIDKQNGSDEETDDQAEKMRRLVEKIGSRGASKKAIVNEEEAMLLKKQHLQDQKSHLTTKLADVKERRMGAKVYDPHDYSEFDKMARYHNKLDDEDANLLFVTRDYRILANKYVTSLNDILTNNTPSTSDEETDEDRTFFPSLIP